MVLSPIHADATDLLRVDTAGFRHAETAQVFLGQSQYILVITRVLIGSGIAENWWLVVLEAHHCAECERDAKSWHFEPCQKKVSERRATNRH